MKRQGNLIESIADIDNLRLAYYKAKKGKAHKASVQLFGANLDKNMLQLQNELLSGEVKVGNYHYFTIYDPKERKICAADFSERVLHHAIMNVCHPYFEEKQVYDSYASRVGKGTYKALDRAATYCKKYKWFAKLDVWHYFEQIDHAILKNQLGNVFKDKQLLAILACIIDTYESDIGADYRHKGVPIGNLTSQYFANHYLSFADRFAKETLKLGGYVRYMDDMLLFDNDKEALLAKVAAFTQFLQDSLALPLKPVCLNHQAKGLPFLGYLLYPHTIKLAQRSRKRFIQKYKDYTYQLEIGNWTEADYQAHILPLIAYTEKADAKAFRLKVIQDSKQRG